MRSSARFTSRSLVRGGSWADAVEQNGHSQAGAVLTAAGRLLFWHSLQPLMYFLVLELYAREIDDLQFVLGCLVAVREGAYVLSSIA